MGKAVLLNVNGIEKLTTDVTYDDIVWLYKDFEEKHGRLPLTSEGLAKNNLPQGRIIKRVLEENNITYNDFMFSLGKTYKIRTESKDYFKFVEKYKSVVHSIGRTPTMKELTGYALPSHGWFVKYCPDNNVKTYNDFVRWCGFEIEENSKEKVSKSLINLEKQFGRPLVNNDIVPENVGFSMIVVNRLWGSLGKCKQELGLTKTLPVQPKPFDYYRELLDTILDNISKATDRRFISWKDIEDNRYNPGSTEHKTFTKSFKTAGVDIFAYIKSKGFQMNPSSFSFHYTFDDGERVVSSFEYDFSQFLRSLCYTYQDTYHRDILYRSFVPDMKKSKSNCDYVINLDGIFYYIEIAGVISKDWETVTYSSKQETDYQEKMRQKKKWLESAGVKYLFLFPEDFKNDDYKNITMNFLQKHAKEEVNG